jgi:hypothetical protein
MVIIEPGSTALTSSASASKTVISGTRSEAKAITSSVTSMWQGRMPRGSRMTNMSPLPTTPQIV